MMGFKVPWLSIAEYPPDNGVAVSRQAKSEIGPGHPLVGKKLKTLARRQDCDDVLFLLDGGPEVAVVHLTWSSRRETTGFPDANCFSDLSEFMNSRMEADRIEFGED
jgi:hypothetical protein